jgi:hypothetical protein
MQSARDATRRFGIAVAQFVSCRLQFTREFCPLERALTEKLLECGALDIFGRCQKALLTVTAGLNEMIDGGTKIGL